MGIAFLYRRMDDVCYCRMPQAISMDQRMQQADLPFRGADFIVLMGIIGMVTGLVMAILFQNIVSGLLLGLMAILACFFWLQLHIQQRRAAFSNQLGDGLVMSIRSIFLWLPLSKRKV